MHAVVKVKTIQCIMRHSTLTLTMDRYMHVLSEKEFAAVESFPGLNPKTEKTEPETMKSEEIETVENPYDDLANVVRRV